MIVCIVHLFLRVGLTLSFPEHVLDRIIDNEHPVIGLQPNEVTYSIYYKLVQHIFRVEALAARTNTSPNWADAQASPRQDEETVFQCW